MNSAFRKLSRLVLLSCAALTTLAFPPAPNHLIFGIVRDQIGNPLDISGAQIFLETSAGVKVTGVVVPQLEPSINYRLEVPMDAGLTADAYQPTALLPSAPFRLRVRIGQATYLPIEMTANLAQLGLPGGRTRIDLTLGIDEDGNGIPDAWEKAAAAFLGLTWSRGSIQPDALYPGTGLTFRAVYLAGTYAMDPEDGFALKILNDPGQQPTLAFTAVKGRTYVIEVSNELGEWMEASFRTLPVSADSHTTKSLQATTTQRVEIEPLAGALDHPNRFYRLIVR